MIVINEIETKNILTKTRVPAGDYAVNPYIGCPHKCMYCYADFMRRFTHHHEKWGDFLDVKMFDGNININKLSDKKIIFSSVTDAYNLFEQKFKITQYLLKQFINTDIKIDILTKSDLILRDIDIFKKIPNISVGISLNTLDENIRKKLEPYASNVHNRINAIKTLNNEGIDTYIFISPIFPGITDFKEILNTCKKYTKRFYFENLNLRGSFRQNVLKYIRDNHNDLIWLYEDIYKMGNQEYWKTMEKEIDTYCRKHKIKYGSYFYHTQIKKKWALRITRM